MEVVGEHVTRDLCRVRATVALTTIVDRLEFGGRDHAIAVVPEKDGVWGRRGRVNLLRQPMVCHGIARGARTVVGEKGRRASGGGSSGHFERKEKQRRGKTGEGCKKAGNFLQILKTSFQFF